VWGPGLYSDDFAADLRPAIRALRRLPMSGDEIVHLLVGLHPAAELPEDEDHSTFWMVVADQLHRSGIPSIATPKALDLIRSGTAIAASADLGMEPRDLRKRAASLEKLAEMLGQPPPVKKRSVLKKPQPLLLQPGEVYAYPADSRGNGINPYFPDAEIERRFEQTCWGSMLVSAAGHEFEFLAWYRMTRSRAYAADLPNFETAVSQIDPSRGAVGPLTANQLRRIRLHALGRIDGFAPISPEPEQVTYSVANDIGVSGTLDEWAQPGTFP
jgi:hypothetical protein